MKIKHTIRKLMRRLGYDIALFSPESHLLSRRKQIIQYQKIDTVLDIGANIGQYAIQLREEIAFSGKIISFEPMSDAFKQLKVRAQKDVNWKAYNFALGNCLEKQKINISRNSFSSSLLDMLPSHIKYAPDSKYINSETIEVKTLDSIWMGLNLPENSNVYMKMDTQGFERKILQGAINSLKNIKTIQMEISLILLYEGEALLQEMLGIMQKYGYTLIGLEPGFSDKDTGQLLQTDGIFHRFGDITYENINC